MSKNKNKGGMFKGKLHSEGGIPIKIKETNTLIEVEGDEPLIASEAMNDNTIRKRKGKNIEILDQINKKVGAKGMREKATEVHIGDAIVCRKSAYDKTKREYIGSDRQIVSAINRSGGCREIERGAKAIEPDGTVTQYKKGGKLNEIQLRWNKKKKHIEELAKNTQRLKLNLTKALKSDDEKDFLTALVISVMMKTGERVGNYNSAKNGRFGVTGFKKNHIKINDTTVTLDYVGKSGVQHEKKFTDKILSEHLKKALDNSPSKYVFTTSDGFRIKADRVNRYLEDFNITAKDIRGFSCNNWILEKLEKIEIPKEEKERQILFNKIAKSVAGKIGHGVATLKKHYLMPEIPYYYINEGKIINVKEAGIYAIGGSVEYKSGGVLEEDKKDIYNKWKDLVNMSASELEKFMDSKEGKEAGLSKEEADKLGIHYGRESARWIIKMKNTPVKEWTPKMWEWANRQISFNSRMRGNRGKLYDDKGNKTRKHLSLLIWGHNPEKYENGGTINNDLSIKELEKKLGRKLNWWNDYEIEFNGIIYRKAFLSPYYKKIK